MCTLRVHGGGCEYNSAHIYFLCIYVVCTYTYGRMILHRNKWFGFVVVAAAYTLVEFVLYNCGVAMNRSG